MRRLWLLNIILFISICCKSQTIVDSCFTSIDFGYAKGYFHLNFPETKYIKGNYFWLAEWDEEKWTTNPTVQIIVDRTPDLPILNNYTRGLFVGYTDSDVNKWDEFIALKLNKPLKYGKEYSYTFTYASIQYNVGSNRVFEFSPSLLTNKKPKIKKAEKVQSLPPVGYNWESNTITFTATKKQKGHRWIIFDVSGSGYAQQAGGILDMCTKLPSKEVVLVVSKDSMEKSTIENLEEGESIVLKNILFETGKSELLSTSFLELDKLVNTFILNQELKVEIRGYTDNQGNEKDNLILSEGRAKAVVEYLILKGISSEKLTYLGLGSTNPIAPNDTEEGKSKNRRVEFMVITK